MLIQKRPITAGSNLQGFTILVWSADKKKFLKISISNMQKCV